MAQQAYRIGPQLGLVSGVADANRRAGLASGFSKIQAGDESGWKEAFDADPETTMNAWNTQQRLKQQEKQIGLMTPYQQAMLGIEERKLGALEDKKAAEDLLKAQEEQKSIQNAQSGVNTMKDVADRNRLSRFQNSWFNSWDKGIQEDQGMLASAIAAVAPRAISKLKAAGVSGVNTLGEFMTYVGLPENATSAQIAAAVPLISEIIGVDNPYSADQNSGTTHTKSGGKVNIPSQDEIIAELKRRGEY